ncbi:MAG: DUF4173 domain-containing protein [Ruminococcus sp.]|uniref:DUF4153 domain-containing protein n=1 Tax=Ruminococcus sp. TaxID=41978 RepID=UPI0025D7495A|nr:DUF4173 domain-containing protein [Ruminococcus sp.]MBO4866938.1 DUF4173 domain-containing protein [Ruminococcus sp.]
MEFNNPINGQDNAPQSDVNSLPLTLGTYPSVVAPKEKTVFTKSEKILALTTFVIAYGVVQFALWNTSGFFTTGLCLLFIAVIIGFLKKTGHKFKASHKLWSRIIIAFSTVFSITANDLIKTLDLVFLLIASTHLVYCVCAEKELFGRFSVFEFLKSSLENPISHSGKEFSAVGSSLNVKDSGAKIKAVIGGLILAIPLTLVVGGLLMSADKGVETILLRLTGTVDVDDFFTVIWKIVLAAPIASYLFGVLYSHTHPEKINALDEENCISFIRKLRFISNTVVYTSVTPICLLYVLFFISQANYFLSAFLNKLPADYSYAEYARRGFFELFAIELINAGVIFAINFFSKKAGEEKPRALRFYTVMISVFTLLITATAISKMVLYIQNYGLTQLRVYTTWFMVLTALIFVYVIIRQFKANFPFMRAAAMTFTLMFALLCFSRPDAVIARYNMEYCSEQLTFTDIKEMCDLSSDASAVITEDQYKSLICSKYMEDKSNSELSLNKGLTGDEYICNRISQKLDKSVYNYFNFSALKLKRQISQ